MTLSNWQSTLTLQNAHWADGAVQHFGNLWLELNHTQDSTIMCDLSHLALLELSGADANSFLQGQVTNDVKQLQSDMTQLSGYCNPKGRLLALFLAFSHQEHLYLQLPSALAASIHKRLKMYVMRSKVEIQEASERIHCIGVNGPDARNILSNIYNKLPTENYRFIEHNHVFIMKLPTMAGHDRYQIFIDIENVESLWSTLKSKAMPAGKACWDFLDIHAGIPEVSPLVQEQFVPQMLNLDLLHGISFKKGCYTGQEIVARTHYLGTVKRRTFLAELSVADHVHPTAGDKLLDKQGAEVGQIVRTCPTSPNHFSMLAELRIDAQQTNEIYWQSHMLIFKALPYSLEIAGN